MSTFPTWWEQYPGRLQFEYDELEAAGIAVIADDQARQSGVIRWELMVPDRYTGRGEQGLTATFPEFYPHVRPDVRAHSLAMGHHQHPFGKNLCLIGRASRAWQPRDTLAWLITSQLSTVLELGMSGAGGDGEEDQGEPFSDYYSAYASNAVVLVDSDWRLPAHPAAGMATLRIQGSLPLDETRRTSFTIASLTGSDGTPVATLPASIAQLSQGSMEVQGRWGTLSAPVAADSAQAIWGAAEEADPVSCQGCLIGGRTYQFRLVAFPEEHARNSTGTGWVLLVRIEGELIKPARKERRSGHPARRSPRVGDPTYQLVRAGRVGVGDFRARTPELTALSDRRVLLIGAGALGSVIAQHLARAGVGELTILDGDVLEAGNLARHACTMSQVGMNKAAAVAALVQDTHPYTAVRSGNFAVGGVTSGEEQRRILGEEFAQTDLVVDATAEVGVQELTAALAARTSTAWVLAEATNGAWGGSVVRVPAEADWCFACFQYHRVDGTMPIPPANPAPPTQPVGCAEPTFIGAAHDLSEVALHAVRTIVAELGGKPVFDAATVVLHDPDGGPTIPTWSAHTLTRHDQCEHS